MRGTYVPPGKEHKELKEGERKLYLAIEATSEIAIGKAKKEITRLIKEELVRLVSTFIFTVLYYYYYLFLILLFVLFIYLYIYLSKGCVLYEGDVHCLTTVHHNLNLRLNIFFYIYVKGIQLN